MNWEAAGALGELVGAVAVVVSIIYLAVQIKTNTRAVRATAGFESTHSWAAFNEFFASLPDEHLALMMRSFDPEGSWESFSDIERMRLGVLFRALFQKLEGQYYLYRYENLDAGIWNNRARFAAGLLKLPFLSRWWRVEKEQLVYSGDFVAALEAMESIAINQEVLGRHQQSPGTGLEADT